MIHRLALLGVAAGALAFGQTDLLRLASPGGQIEFQIFAAQQADTGAWLRLAYRVSFHGKPLIDQSYLGLEIHDQPILGENYGLSFSKRESIKTYNSLVAEYSGNGTLGRHLVMEVRAYDEGVAFRYRVPRSDPLDDAQVEDENTEFRFAQDGNVQATVLPDFGAEHVPPTRQMLSQIPRKSLMSKPVLVEQPGVGWVAITEANLDNYAGLHLVHPEGTMLLSRLPGRPDDPSLAVRTRAPFDSPWRVLMIGTDPARFDQSKLLADLPASSWIRPIK